jgi:kynurenine 3-monooxygenase
MNMISTSRGTTDDNNVRHVVIAGAGPAGLLLANLLLRRNNEKDTSPSSLKYRVTLVESREDLGVLDPETELKAHRSWMISLASHGLDACRTIPELYDNYISNVGVRIRSLSIFLGAKEIKNEIDEVGNLEAYIVDRNFVVAALARYLNHTYGNNPNLDRRYDTKLMYVDHENHRVLTRKGDKEEYIQYDLLIGSDGVRSVVREALVKKHQDFEMDVGDIFQTFKAVHIVRPKQLSANSMTLLPTIFPNMQGIGLPELDGQINISVGCPRNKFDQLASELKSSDPKVVADYFKKNLKAFEVQDYDDLAEKWIACPWMRTGMVHCNFYHSLPCKIVIMGDAAHATSPSIGMGMNTALRDAQKFNELLDKFDDDLEQVLPQFSKDRVKEGNSLSDLALNLYCFDTRHQLLETVHMIVRGILSPKFPWLISQHPQMVIGDPQWQLADVYQLASDQGIIQKHSQINNRIRQEYFEMETGMITRKPTSSMRRWVLFVGLVAIPVFLVAYKYFSQNYYA